MSIKLELDADSIKKAITTHISNQGFDLAGKTVEVALVNGRGGNGNRATITISDDAPERGVYDTPIASLHTASEMVAKDVKEIADAVTEAPVELPEVPEEVMPVISQGEVELGVVDPILAAAEGASDPFASADEAGEEGLFPVVNPADVKAPASLF